MIRIRVALWVGVRICLADNWARGGRADTLQGHQITALCVYMFMLFRCWDRLSKPCRSGTDPFVSLGRVLAHGVSSPWRK